jgi:hypothetical protein
MSVLWPIHVALITRLKSDWVLSQLVDGRIYDGVAPQHTPTPYIVVGDPTEEERDPLGRRAYEDTAEVHTWSSYQGRKEATQIMAAVSAALHAPLVIDGHKATRLRRDFAGVVVEDDGTRHGVQRFRTLVMETS